MEKSDFRIKEFNGLFEIQRKRVTKKTNGILWWKKTTIETEWLSVDKYGEFFSWCFGKFNRPPIKKFTNLEKALEKIEMFVNGASYHYPKD